MATFFDNPSCLTRLAGVINILGRSFTSVTSVLNVVFMFVRGDGAIKGDAENIEQSLPDAGNNDTQIQPLSFQFSAFVENVSFLYPEVFAGSGSFKAFDDFCKDKGYMQLQCDFCEKSPHVSCLWEKSFGLSYYP